MKIAIIVYSFLPKWIGGTEVATDYIAKRLAARGHEVHILTAQQGGEVHESVDGRVHVHRIYMSNLRLIGFAAWCLSILHTLRRIDPDVIHTQNILAGPPGVLAKKALKKPHVVWMRSYDFQSMKRVAKIVLRNADEVIAQSDDMRRALQQVWPRNVWVIPNGIDLEVYEVLSRDGARRQLQIAGAEKVVLRVGSLFPVKGVEYLIQAMAYVRQKEPNVRLIIVGDGPERENLQILTNNLGLSERVSFVGRIQHDEIPYYMVAADVFVLPSISEGFPVVSLEAMAAALPIVASDVGGIPSIVDEGINGFLVKPRDAAQIADKVLQLLNNDEMSDRISRSNREKARQYTWDNVVTALEQVYSSCLMAS